MAPERTIDYLLLVVAGFQSLWYALATAVAFALVMAARQRYVSSRLYVREEAD